MYVDFSLNLIMKITHTVVTRVAKSKSVWMSYSITRLQYRRAIRKIAVSSCDLSDKPAFAPHFAKKHYSSTTIPLSSWLNKIHSPEKEQSPNKFLLLHFKSASNTETPFVSSEETEKCAKVLPKGTILILSNNIDAMTNLQQLYAIMWQCNHTVCISCWLTSPKTFK